jgi:DNA-binding transcriptional MocR family regulator
MTRGEPTVWKPKVARRAGPAYRAIADALEADLRDGRLEPGDALPTQRALAAALGLNFTTVTRGYAEARRRGLITATVGRGTFVSGAASPDSTSGTTGDHELSVSTPPAPRWMAAVFQDTLTRLARDPVLTRKVVGYDMRLGDESVRHAGTTWLRARGLDPPRDRVVATAGAQHALSMLMGTITRPGDTVVTEALTYPGLQGVASTAGVRVVGIEMDRDGLRPDALEAACAEHRPRMLCCVPSLHNPTNAVMPVERRREVLAIARRHNVHVVEDDIYGPLLPVPAPAPLAALAPELVTYVGSLSKCVAPGLRTAFVLSPTSADASRLDAAVRTSLLMLSPLPLAVASAWIADGTAERAVADIGREAVARTAIARRILGGHRVAAPDGSLHAWLSLPASWTLAAFVASAQQRGVRVAPADWYVTPTTGAAPGPVPPAAVRLALGAEPDRSRLEHALRSVASMLDQPAGLRASNP